MITFYPRDIGMWRKDFTFPPDLGAVSENPTDRRVFNTRRELIDFLVSRGVRNDDLKNPLAFERTHHPFLEGEVFAIIQFSIIGWMVDPDARR